MIGSNRNQRDRHSSDAVLSELLPFFGNRIQTGRAICEQHANTVTWIDGQPPDGVVYPTCTEDVQRIVDTCRRHDVPIIPFGAGTSFEGSVNAPHGGISIDFAEMNRIVSVNAGDLDCVVEPGLTRLKLNEALRDNGLFFSVDPGADASVGGMASTRASGTTAVRYGTMKDNVLGLKVVLANGEVMKTSTRAKKSAAGYDLTRLIVGAEGTLGIITELTLKLHGIPESISSGRCRFPSLTECCNAAIAALQSGIPLARIELLDEIAIRASNAYSRLELAEHPTLFVEFHGSDNEVKEQSSRFADIVSNDGGHAFEWSTRTEDRNRLWKARHDLFWAVSSYRPGAKVVTTDACVPISRLAECITETKADLERSDLCGPIVAHAGDGNFHVSLCVMMEDHEEVARAKAFIDRVADRAIAMEGTCTGEHGIGQGKKKFLPAERGQFAVDAMRAIKAALDPSHIMNPGKIF